MIRQGQTYYAVDIKAFLAVLAGFAVALVDASKAHSPSPFLFVAIAIFWLGVRLMVQRVWKVTYAQNPIGISLSVSMLGLTAWGGIFLPTIVTLIVVPLVYILV